jgi:hypothetical protein
LGERIAPLFTRLPARVLRVTSLAVVWMPPRILIAHDDSSDRTLNRRGEN